MEHQKLPQKVIYVIHCSWGTQVSLLGKANDGARRSQHVYVIKYECVSYFGLFGDVCSLYNSFSFITLDDVIGC